MITTRNLDLGDSLRTYIEKKVSKLDRYLPDIHEARVELTNQNTRSPEHSQVAQLTLFSNKGAVLRAEERSADMRSSIDAVLEKMSRQIRRYKGKHWRSQNRHQLEELAEAELEVEPEPEEGQSIVRIKRFETRPMDVEEAIEQMELLGHDFFIFYNMATSGFNVVYRRRDGGYGLLIPELA
ncbi:MAG: ribosome-associated translation inhibitor RaiA [Chloroflexi bacterium]|nr:ribosome-associated translation inhibitor RaiA [Chloroflexota bacterium]